jgi:hypothetical protein
MNTGEILVTENIGRARRLRHEDSTGEDKANICTGRDPVLQALRFPPPILCILPPVQQGESSMAAAREKTTKDIDSDAVAKIESDVVIDRTAPAGSKNSLGAQSVRDGRPATDDSTVEAMDEEGPDITAR